MADYLLDTCAAIWIMNGDPLRDPAATELPQALERNGRLVISPITAWEIATLVAKKRILLTLRPEVWFSKLCDLPRCNPCRYASLSADCFDESPR